MKATPKFHGVWYGVNCTKGEEQTFPDRLRDKILNRKDLFTTRGRKKKNDQDKP